MSREYVLVPKQKYESMLRSFEEDRNQSKIQSEQQQEGGAVETSQPSFSDGQLNERHKKEHNILDAKAPSKAPTRLFVKRPLTKMKFCQNNQ